MKKKKKDWNEEMAKKLGSQRDLTMTGYINSWKKQQQEQKGKEDVKKIDDELKLEVLEREIKTLFEECNTISNSLACEDCGVLLSGYTHICEKCGRDNVALFDIGSEFAKYSKIFVKKAIVLIKQISIIDEERGEPWLRKYIQFIELKERERDLLKKEAGERRLKKEAEEKRLKKEVHKMNEFELKENLKPLLLDKRTHFDFLHPDYDRNNPKAKLVYKLKVGAIMTREDDSTWGDDEDSVLIIFEEDKDYWEREYPEIYSKKGKDK